MSSFKELHERYEELVKLTHEELVEKIGSWWADMFEQSKEDIRQMREGKKDE